MLETLTKVQPWPFTVETARLCRSELNKSEQLHFVFIFGARACATTLPARARRGRGDDQLFDHVTTR